MTVSLTHAFVSSIPDGPDATQVRPSNWNAEHVLSMDTARLLGRTTAGTGPAEEISVGSGLSLSAGVLSATGGGISDGNKGSITVSGGGATWTINALAVDTAELATNAVATIKIQNNAVNDTKLRDSAGTSVIGRSAGTTGDPADIVAAADGDVLRRSGGALGFGSIPAASVTGLAAIATSGSASDLSAGTLPAARFDDTAHGTRGGGTLHAAFTSGAAGFAPASGGGTTNFLRADGTWAAPPGGGSGSPGGSSGQAQWNNAGSFGGSAGLTMDASNVTLAAFANVTAVTAPAAPSSGTRVYGVAWAGTPWLGETKPGLPAMLLAPTHHAVRMFEVRPQSGTAISVIGVGTSNGGTVSHPTMASTNYYTATHRFQIATAAAANATGGWRGATLPLWRGNAAGFGGFHFTIRAGVESLVSDGRFGIGLSSSTAALGAGDPSANLADWVGIEKGTADTNWWFARRTGTGTAVRLDLGTAVAASQLLEVHIACDANGSDLRVLVDVFNNTTGARTTLLSATYSTDIPANTTFLGPRYEGRTGAAATAISMVTAYAFAIGGA